jgi:anti-sigma B factor antagonist
VNIENHVELGILRVRVLDKRMDAHGAPDFKQKLTAMVERGNRLIALDISNVEFIDSSGLGVLVSLLKQLGGQGEIAIGGVRDSVGGLFKLTRLDKVFQIFSDPQAAIEALAQP